MPFLDWVNKAQAVSSAADVPYHLLQFESAHGDAGAEAGYAGKPRSGCSQNLLIQGDNLTALKALLPFYRGQVKCIYIDPPYNTQSAFEHYDDKLEHSQWLSTMYPRLVLLRELLAEDGSIWVSIDDNEGHYLKVLMDEVFGRGNFVSSVIWQKKYAPKSDSKYLSESHDFILAFAKKLDCFKLGRITKTEKQTSRYTNRDNDSRGPWKASDVLRSEARDYAIFPVRLPSGSEVWPPLGTSWRYTKEKFAELIADNRIWFGVDGNARPAYKRFLSEVTESMPATTVWLFDEVGHNDESKKEMRALFSDSLFATPKPERLLQRILHIATNPGDLVLDSFLGSGTTAAVAHKMGRRWIGIEMGGHAVTHCLPRLEKVIAGEQGGISQTVNWQGGGGFRFHTLGEPVFDADGGIHPAVRFKALAAFLWHFETGEPYCPSPAGGYPHPNLLPGGEGAMERPQGSSPWLYSAEAEQHTRKGACFDLPLLGIHNGTAYFLLYNGILGDRRPQGGNVLTTKVLAHLEEQFPHTGPRVIYGETTRLGEARLRESGIIFKQIPYDIKAR
ncbi:MAG: site-specific DNA-methyltransferase [Sulfuricellaceae bacterium]|nr:site-specific DNA-methyltransferase [Sulfuricellaceae bacterium]